MDVAPLGSVVRRHRDVLVAVVMLGLGEWQVLAGADGAGRVPVAAPAVVVFSAALAFRRRNALAAATVMAICWLACALLDAPQSSIWGLVLVLVMAYAAAAYETRRRAVIGLFLLVGAAYASTWLTPGSELGDRLFTAPVLVGGPWAAGVLARRFREQARLMAVLNSELEERRAHDVEEAARRERTRIARELHDVVSHGLGMITVQAAAALRVLDIDPERARSPLEDIRVQGKEALADMRTMLGLLSDDDPPAVRRGLLDVPDLVGRLRAAGVTVEYDVAPELPVLAAEQDLVVYRVVQEAITNALKHGQVTRLGIRVHSEHGGVLVEVEDDGVKLGEASGTGRGLPAMRTRAAMVGGRVEAGPRGEGGWRVRLSLPARGVATP